MERFSKILTKLCDTQICVISKANDMPHCKDWVVVVVVAVVVVSDVVEVQVVVVGVVLDVVVTVSIFIVIVEVASLRPSIEPPSS